MNAIPYGKQHISNDDIDAVIEVLKSDYLTQGPKIKEFEIKFSEYINVKYCIAVANGTAALHLSALALNVKPGDKVLTTPLTFAASANCIKYCGGKIDFVDIDPKTYLIDLNQIEDKLKKAPKGTYKGVIPVDFAGYPVNLEELKILTDKYDCWIIEDACHAPGGYFINKNQIIQKCGNSNYADLAIFSFHPVKHIATGEGGIITTNNQNLYNKLQLLRNHGITKDADLLEENHGGWYYEMLELGYNYRITDIQCALGISQINHANYGLKRRNEIAQKYDQAFKNTKIIPPFRDSNIYHAFHLYVIQVEKRKELYDYLRSYGIFTQVHYIPLHLQPFYKKLGWKKGDLSRVEAYYEKCLSLPIYPSLKNEEQDYVIHQILDFIK